MHLLVRWVSCASLLAVAASPCLAGKPSGLLPDYAAHLVCPQQSPSEVESIAVTFLSSRGFQVLNLSRVQRQHDVSLQRVRVIGIDSQDRMVEFMSLDYVADRYAMRFNSEPPTRRSPDFDQAIQSVPSSFSSCRLVQPGRATNAASAIPFFRSEVRRVRSLLREAAQLKGK